MSKTEKNKEKDKEANGIIAAYINQQKKMRDAVTLDRLKRKPNIKL